MVLAPDCFPLLCSEDDVAPEPRHGGNIRAWVGEADAGACVGSFRGPAGPAHDPAPASRLRDAPWKVWQPFTFSF